MVFPLQMIHFQLSFCPVKRKLSTLNCFIRFVGFFYMFFLYVFLFYIIHSFNSLYQHKSWVKNCCQNVWQFFFSNFPYMRALTVGEREKRLIELGFFSIFTTNNNSFANGRICRAEKWERRDERKIHDIFRE